MIKLKAWLESLAIFVLTLVLIAGVSQSPLGTWEREVSAHPFVEYAVMMAVPSLFLLALRRNPEEYGISLRNSREQFHMALRAFPAVAVVSAISGMVNYRQWHGALILGGAYLALLFVLGKSMEKLVNPEGHGLAGGMVFSLMSWAGKALAALVFYLFFLGLGEELLFRGYLQSRLNQAFGKPFLFFGVAWGWGVVLSAALFGGMHILNLGSLVSGHWQPAPWWGLWTFFAGLVLGFVREKSGGILAPVLLHGLPQALAEAVFGQ